MLKEQSQSTLAFDNLSTDHFKLLCGPQNQFLKSIEQHYAIVIQARNQIFSLTGEPQLLNQAEQLLNQLAHVTAKGQCLNLRDLKSLIQQTSNQDDEHSYPTSIRLGRQAIKARTQNQARYLDKLLSYDVNFAVGPAGTGKTYLAVACALQALQNEEVERIILSRPIVEAGESLGFLPGDIHQKVDPYLKPLYDALNSMLTPSGTQNLIDKGTIEITPLAYMRGRTFNHAFIIVDEAQNTTAEQMKMLLTRLGLQSKLVVTGDMSQTDLPVKVKSGLADALAVLTEVEAIQVSELTQRDTQRHPLVKQIIRAYEQS